MALLQKLGRLLSALARTSPANLPRPHHGKPSHMGQPDPVFGAMGRPVIASGTRAPKGATLYRFWFEYAAHKGTLEVVARSSVNAQSKAAKRVVGKYGEQPLVKLQLTLLSSVPG